MARQGREFEELVVRIERLLCPTGAKVKSPDFIKEITTGNSREVDASIRFIIGSVPVLITVECRDRVSIEDVTWIEQLVTKKQNLGASETILVSSKGFSTGAIQNARKYGMKIRTIEDISDQEILDWKNRLTISGGQVICAAGPLTVYVQLTQDASSNISLDPDDGVLYQKNGLNADVLIRAKNGLRCSIFKIYAEEIASRELKALTPGEQFTIPPMTTMHFTNEPMFLLLLQGVPNDGTVVSKKLVMEFPKGDILIKTNLGNVVVFRLEVDIRISVKQMATPPTKVLEYRSDEKSLIQLAETELPIDERKNLKLTISQYRLLN